MRGNKTEQEKYLLVGFFLGALSFKAVKFAALALANAYGHGPVVFILWTMFSAALFLSGPSTAAKGRK